MINATDITRDLEALSGSGDAFVARGYELTETTAIPNPSSTSFTVSSQPVAMARRRRRLGAFGTRRRASPDAVSLPAGERGARPRGGGSSV
jgi:hypothetical protein